MFKKFKEDFVVEDDEVGKIHFRRNPRCKRMTIRLKPFAGIVVSLPVRTSVQTAVQFVAAQKDWIAKNLPKVKEQEKNATTYDGSSTLHTRQRRLQVEASKVASPLVTISAKVVRLQYPEDWPLLSNRVQEVVRWAMVEAYRLEAKEYLPGRLRSLADEHGFHYNKVFIKNHKSRWGSCSSKNNINLSLHLMRLPDELIDYVILHELVHTEIKNHSSAFWHRVREVCPGFEKLRQKLKLYDATI